MRRENSRRKLQNVVTDSTLKCIGTQIANAADPPSFKSHLFEQRTLVYSDDFDEAFDKNRWEPRTKTWEVKDGMLIGAPDFKNAEDAEKAFGADKPNVVIILTDDQGWGGFECSWKYQFGYAEY